MRRLSLILKLSVASVALVAGGPHVVFAQDGEDTKDAIKLKTIVVEASRTDRVQADMAQTVSVRTSEDIERQQATTVGEVLDRIPGVSMSNGFYSHPTVRGGAQGQVIINVDGVDQTSSTNKGMSISPLDIDPMLVEQVEVIKGSSAALYGSGGIGGVISIRTKQVQDLLEDGKLMGGFVRTRFDTADRTLRGTAAMFGRTSNNQFDYIVTADGYNGEQYKGDPSSHVERQKYNFTGQFGWNIDDSQRLQLNLKKKYREFTSSVVKDDEVDDSTVQLRYNIERGDHVNAKVNASYNMIEREANFTNASAGKQDSKLRRIQFDAQNSHMLSFAGTDNVLTYGGSLLATNQDGKVNGKIDNFANANGDRKEYGAFVQNVMDWRMFSLATGLRYVNFNMEGGDGKNDMDEQAFMPSVGLTVRATDWLNLYASYSHDFRAPSIDDMYTAQRNDPFRLVIVPNPDLKPERSVNREVGFMLHKQGLVGEDDYGMIRFSYYNQNVKNLMELGMLPDREPGTNYLQFTTRNVARAVRSGIEVEASYKYDNFTMTVAGERSRVEDRSGGKVEDRPWNIRSMLAYSIPQYGVDLAWYTDAFGGSEKNKTGDYVIHGVRARWQDPLNIKGLEISGGIRNLFDRDYRNQWKRKGEKRTFLVGAAYKF